MKRIALILLTPALAVLLIWGLADKLLLPLAATWLKEQIEKVSANPSFPVEVHVQDIELRLFRPTAIVRGLEILPRGDLAKTMGPLKIQSVVGRLNLFEAALGRFQFGAVYVQGLEASLNIDPLLDSKEEAQPLPLDLVFQWAARLPLKGVSLIDSKIQARSQKFAADGTAEIRTILLTNLGTRLQFDATAPHILVHRGGELAFDLALSADLTPKELTLGSLRLRMGDIVIRAQGRAMDPANLPVKPNLDLKASTEITLDRLAEQIQKIQPQTKLPALAGTLTASTEIHLKGTSDFESAVRLKTAAVRVGLFDVGDAQLEGRLTAKDLTIGQILLSHTSGHAELKDTRLDFRAPYGFKTKVVVNGLDLQALFRALNLNKIPVEADLRGDLPCEGALKPFTVTCTGTANGGHLMVKNKNAADGKTIVLLKDLEAAGAVTIDTSHVEFKSDLRIGKSRGTTEGRVDFDEGFDIKFKTPEIAFADVENLANLKFKGAVALDGFTRGDSDTATFEINARAHDFELEDYILGTVATAMKFRRGHLIFQDLTMEQGRTRATGSMDLDLNDDRIAGEFSSESLDAADVVDLFSNIWRFPLDLQAAGHAHVEFDGPLDFWKLNTKVDAEFKNGRLQGDSFESLTLRSHGVDGTITVDQALLKKGSGTAKVTGSISGDRVLALNGEITNLRLEESEFVNRVRSGVAGQINVTARLQGTVAQPEIRLKGALSDLTVDDRDIPGSFFDLRFGRDHAEGETTLFGNRIQADVRIPYRPGSPLNVRVKTTDWPFTSLLSVIGASNLQNEYESSLTADIDLHSESGRLTELSGAMNLRTVKIQRGATSLRNPSPIEVTLNGGVISLKNAVLEGPGDSLIRVRGDNFRLDRLAVGVQANVDLRLLHLLAPFLEDLGGRLRMEASIAGAVTKPEIIGTASIENAFVKLKGFPHPAEKLQADIVFSQTRISIQGLRGQFAGGTLDGGGTIQINGLNDIPINLRLKAENLTLQVPDKVRSSGNADLQFTGRWFPFTLAGTYNVSSALFEKDFGDGEALGAPRASNYLPKILRQAQFDPVVLDIQVLMPRNVLIKNSLMDGSITGQLQVKGPPQNPGLLGRITTEKGSKITIRNNSFDVTAGTITFNNPDDINPDIYLSAQSRVAEYDITVIVQGPAKPSPVIRMSSVPPLSEQDITSLLALGVVSSQLEGQVKTDQQARQVGYEALGLGLSKTGANKLLERTTGLNMSISSSFDSTKNISVPKVTFTRKLADRLNATYSRPIGGDNASQEFKLQYQLNSNVSAIGSFESRDAQSTGSSASPQLNRQDIFGLDLEFKREFK